MKAREALEQFERVMREDRVAPQRAATFLVHVRGFLAFKPAHECESLEARIADWLAMPSRRRSAIQVQEEREAVMAFYQSIGRPLGELPDWTMPPDAIERFEKGMCEERKARSTKSTYHSHVRSYLRFVPSHPCPVVEDRVSAYLSHLARGYSKRHQDQALNAVVCFYRLLGRPMGKLPGWVSPPEKRRIPTWVTTAEALAIIAHLREPWDEVAMMLFGSGLRIGECLDLRGKDIDTERGTVTMVRGKGDKDRVTLLARSMIPVLERRMACNRAVWEEDRRAGRPGVALPDSLWRKYPRAGEEWPWFWLWPAPGESTDPETKIVRRHHRHEEGFSKALKVAVRRSGVCKRVTAHAFRHGFATAYLENGGTIQELQELLGHTNIETTGIYTHCLPQLASRAASPLDRAGPTISTTTPFRRIA